MRWRRERDREWAPRLYTRARLREGGREGGRVGGREGGKVRGMEGEDKVWERGERRVGGRIMCC